ncbi:HlyD family efflux transporter periplasmic adaptor subunit [Roseibium salinum]|uniref:HlyD family efflux transporter periplasmic adaptor subunit n=1 Tax=Roseibium salinum TaxID=1604349 RepID=UPI00362106E5
MKATWSKGSPILTLDPATDQARLTKLRARYAELNALRTRLEAQKTHADEGSTSQATPGLVLRGSGGSALPILAGGGLPIEQKLNSEQLRQLTKGRQAIAAELRGLQERLTGQRRRLSMLNNQTGNAEQRIAILSEKLAKGKSLADMGYMAQQQVWDLELRLLEARSDLSNLKAEVAATESGIGETQAEMDGVRLLDGRETSRELTEVLAEIEQISDELTAAEQARTQTALRAPVRGYLVHLSTATVGGVVGPAEAIGEIVPADAPLEARAEVPLDKITGVFPGQQADIKISALNPRLYDALPAWITYVAADASRNEATGERFFEVRALLDENALRQTGLSLQPGMNGEIYIKGEARTFATYLLQPFLDGLGRSFREVN